MRINIRKLLRAPLPFEVGRRRTKDARVVRQLDSDELGRLQRRNTDSHINAGRNDIDNPVRKREINLKMRGQLRPVA